MSLYPDFRKPCRNLNFCKVTSLQFLGGILSYLTFFFFCRKEYILFTFSTQERGLTFSEQVVPLSRACHFLLARGTQAGSLNPHTNMGCWGFHQPNNEREFASIQVQVMALAFVCASMVLTAILLTGPFMACPTLFLFLFFCSCF